MIDFAGWHMPVQYQSALKEHLAVRSSVGLFDVSHMGELEISGQGALEAVQHVTCTDLDRIEDGQAQYSAFLTRDGTFVDDIVIRIGRVGDGSEIDLRSVSRVGRGDLGANATRIRAFVERFPG